MHGHSVFVSALILYRDTGLGLITFNGTEKKIFSAAIHSKMIREEYAEGGFLWRCIECGHSNIKKQAVEKHIERKHIESDGFNCQHCGKFCPNKNSLQVHISRHHRGPFSVI